MLFKINFRKIDFLPSSILSLFFILFFLGEAKSQISIDPEQEVPCILARYEFEDNGKDLISGLDAVAFGTTTIAGRLGYADQAVSFDGINDYFELNGNAPIITSATWTINAWVRQTSTGSGPSSQNLVFSQRGDFASGCCLGDPAINIFSNTAGGNAVIVLRPTTGPSVTVSAPAPVGSDWHMYTAIKDSSIVKLFIDGVLVGSTVHSYLTNDFLTGLDYVSVGRHRYSGVNYGWFEGAIDDLRIYDCVLTDGQVSNLFAGIPCNKPVGLNTTGISSSSVTLEWNPILEASAYEIQAMRLSDGFVINKIVFKSSKQISSVSALSDYEWRVKAYCGLNSSAFSTAAMFSTPLRYGITENLKLIPNPASEFTTLYLPKKLSPGWLTIINSEGAFMYKKYFNAESSIRLETSNWPQGLYFIMLNNPSGENTANSKLFIHK